MRSSPRGYVPGIRKEPTEGAKRGHSGSIPSLPAGINEDDSDPVSEPRLARIMQEP